MPTQIDYVIGSFRTTSGGLTSDDLATLRRYGEAGWEVDHAVPTARATTTSCLCSSV
jgi:hypothetical protein